MHVLFWVIGVPVALLALLYLLVLGDAIVGMRTMDPSSVMMSKEPLAEGPGPRVLLVYLPGILARSEDQMVILRDAFAGGLDGMSADLLRIDYTGERFRVRTTVEAVCGRLRLLEHDYDRIVFIGASLGGRLLNGVYEWIWDGDVLFAKAARPIILDAPMDRRDFAAGGSLLALALRVVPIGPLVNRLRLTDRMARPPKDHNIGNMAHFPAVSQGAARNYQEYIDWVKARSMEGLHRHRFSVWRDQIVAMSRMKWAADAFEQHPPLYISCSSEKVTRWTFVEDILPDVKDANGRTPVQYPLNDTVMQPHTVNAWRTRIPDIQHWIVASTHCGFMERPVAWQLAITAAIREVL